LLTLRPLPVRAPSEVLLSVSVKGAEEKWREKVPVPVVPAPGGTLSISFEPPELRGVGSGVLVRVDPTAGPHLPQKHRQIVLHASLGEVGQASPGQDGSWAALYKPPADLEAPAAVLFTALDLTAPERVVGAATLPILQPVTRQLSGPPTSQATLQVGDLTLGPQEVSGEGKVTFDFSMHPAHQVGTLTTRTLEGEEQTTTVDLDNPARPQLAFAPLPEETGVPAGRSVMLWLKATDAAGVPRDRIPDLVIKAPGAPVVRHPGNGWHQVLIQAPSVPGPFEVRAVLGREEAALMLRAVEPLPALEVVAEPDRLGEETAEVTATARYRSGRGGRSLEDLAVQALGVEAAAPPQVVDDALQVRFPVQGADRLAVVASALAAPTGLPPVRLRLWPGLPWAGEGESIPLFVAVEDAFGAPVPGAEVAFGHSERLEGLPEDLSIGDQGWAVVPVSRVADDVVAPLPITATAGPLAGGTLLWPHAGPLGTAADVVARGRWTAALPALVLRPDAPPLGTAVQEAPVAPFPEPDTAGDATPGQRSRPALAAASELEWRVRGGVLDMGLHFRQTRSDDLDVLPDDADFGKPLPLGALGIAASGEVWFVEHLGADLRAQWARYRVDIAGDVTPDGVGLWMVGARYRDALGGGPWGWTAGAWFHRTDAVLFVYDEGRTDADLSGFSINGLRLGGGMTWSPGFGDLRFEIAETLAPLPADTFAGLFADIPLPVEVAGFPLFASAAATFDVRHTSGKVEDTRGWMRDIQGAVLLEVGWGHRRVQSIDAQGD